MVSIKLLLEHVKIGMLAVYCYLNTTIIAVNIINKWLNFGYVTVSCAETLVKIESLLYCIVSLPIHPYNPSFFTIFTLCAYAQQGYVFGRIALHTYVYVYLYICQQKQAV